MKTIELRSLLVDDIHEKKEIEIPRDKDIFLFIKIKK